MKRVLIVGIGPFGIVLARELSKIKELKIEMIEQRDHIAGNCFTQRDSETNVMLHVYGPHIFNTNHSDVWEYVKSYSEMVPFCNRVKAVTPKGVFSLPVNLLTLNQFFGKNLNPVQAKKFVNRLGCKKIKTPKNFQEAALKAVGLDLYKNFFQGYTIKQWGVDPKCLPPDVFKRLPLRFNYDDSYYNTKFQGIPRHGYTALYENILNSAKVRIQLKVSYHQEMIKKYDHIFYSGSIDKFYNYRFGNLNYRTVYFKKQNILGDVLGNAVINYTDLKYPYTRKHEHKHFTPWENHAKTTVFTEFSKKTEGADEPYYPVRSKEDIFKLEQYNALALKTPNISFVGRLGFYRYLDMDQIIGTALDLAYKIDKTKSLESVVIPRNK